MPKLNLKVGKSLEEDLRLFAGLGGLPLQALADRLDAEPTCTIKPSDLRKAIQEAVSLSATPGVERLLMGLSTLRRQSDASVDDILDELGKAVSNANWDVDQLGAWNDVQPALRSLLENRSVIVTAKAVDLLYDYDHFFIGAKILSDVRPVFDDLKSEIVGAVINQTLRMEFSDAAGKKTDISLIVDLDDIDRLRRSCEDALNKGRIITEKLKHEWRVATLTIEEIKNDGN